MPERSARDPIKSLDEQDSGAMAGKRSAQTAMREQRPESLRPVCLAPGCHVRVAACEPRPRPVPTAIADTRRTIAVVMLAENECVIGGDLAVHEMGDHYKNVGL